jgi:hypothetical protein
MLIKASTCQPVLATFFLANQALFAAALAADPGDRLEEFSTFRLNSQGCRSYNIGENIKLQFFDRNLLACQSQFHF